MELRCEHKLHGIIRGDKFETRCDSRLCGKRPGVIVLHTIDLATGEVETKRYQDPPGSRVREKERSSESSGECSPVRTP